MRTEGDWIALSIIPQSKNAACLKLDLQRVESLHFLRMYFWNPISGAIASRLHNYWPLVALNHPSVIDFVFQIWLCVPLFLSHTTTDFWWLLLVIGLKSIVIHLRGGLEGRGQLKERRVSTQLCNHRGMFYIYSQTRWKICKCPVM